MGLCQPTYLHCMFCVRACLAMPLCRQKGLPKPARVLPLSRQSLRARLARGPLELCFFRQKFVLVCLRHQ